MNVKLDHVFGAINQIPWKKIEESIPSKQKKEELESIKSDLAEVLKVIDADQADYSIHEKVSSVAQRFHDLSETINTLPDHGKELYSKSKLNQILAWNLADYPERAIYLAGEASADDKIEEPYRTQIVNQASHGCLTRYRQSWKIRDYIVGKMDGAVSAEIDLCLKQMSRSLLNQLDYFSDLSYKKNSDHALSAYHAMMANLLMANERQLAQQQELADFHIEKAEEIANRIDTPEAGIHYMQRHYHITNYNEFLGFEHLSGKHEAIRARLESLHSVAQAIQPDAVHIPKDYLDIGSIVGTGMRAASIAAVILSGYGFSEVSLDDVQIAISELWQKVGAIIQPGNEQIITELSHSGSDLNYSNTGGLASLVANTGGLANKLSLIA